ncbi:MAG TPA: cupin domain-containing protein [Candidatus Binatia bacterium]
MFRASIKHIADIRLVEQGIDRLSWRDFGNGLSMARLAKEGKRELVLYRIAADAAADAFLKHEHVGGEFYLVLKGRIEDETGQFEPGDLVYLDAHSVHTPRARGDTLVLVLWPEGVELVPEEKIP